VAVLLTWLAFELSGLRLADLVAHVRGASVVWLLAAVGLVFVDRAVMAWRWIRLLRATGSGADLRLGGVLRVFFISSFAGTFMPGAGDAVRAMGVARLDVSGGDALGSVVVDRLLGMLSMLALGLAGLLFAGLLTAGPLAAGPLVEARVVLVALAVSVAAAAAAILLLFDSRVLHGLVRMTSGGRFPRGERLAGKALDGIRQYGWQRRVLAVVFASSLAIQGLRTLQAWCLGLAVGLDVAGVWYVAFVPLITLIMQLPISVSGIGTSQLAFQYFFEGVGGDPALAVVVSVLYLALGWVGILPGGLLLMAGPSSRPPAPERG
jgi:uncharacterized protein (TIRG00374 family)